MKHFETKFASTDFKVNFLNLKKIKKFFLENNKIFKKLIRNYNLPAQLDIYEISLSDLNVAYSQNSRRSLIKISKSSD